MTSLWGLPRQAVIDGVSYPIHSDFRDILEIITYLEDETEPEFVRWQIALALFYPTVPADTRQAMTFLADFISGGQQTGRPGPKLLDWQQDAQLIIADVNRAAGQELRSLPYVHWWSFLSWFHAIGEGQLSTVVAIRNKLHKGQKLEAWEQEFYRANRQRVDIRKADTEQKQQLLALLEGRK